MAKEVSEEKTTVKNPPITKTQREFSAGGVVYKKVIIRRGAERVEVLWLTTKSAPSKLYPEGFWRLPKGWLDDENVGKKPGPKARGDAKADEQELREAAVREVAEEGGVEAKIIKKLGTERIFFTKSSKRILKFITFYLMEWLRDLPEGPGFETSEVAWLPFEEARKRLKYSSEKRVLDKAKETLNSGIQENLMI